MGTTTNPLAPILTCAPERGHQVSSLLTLSLAMHRSSHRCGLNLWPRRPWSPVPTRPLARARSGKPRSQRRHPPAPTYCFSRSHLLSRSGWPSLWLALALAGPRWRTPALSCACTDCPLNRAGPHTRRRVPIPALAFCHRGNECSAVCACPPLRLTERASESLWPSTLARPPSRMLLFAVPPLLILTCLPIPSHFTCMIFCMINLVVIILYAIPEYRKSL
jgi:hypothetical protein